MVRTAPGASPFSLVTTFNFSFYCLSFMYILYEHCFICQPTNSDVMSRRCGDWTQDSGRVCSKIQSLFGGMGLCPLSILSKRNIYSKKFVYQAFSAKAPEVGGQERGCGGRSAWGGLRRYQHRRRSGSVAWRSWTEPQTSLPTSWLARGIKGRQL